MNARSVSGADDGTRTRDLLITNQLLYQLSYVGVVKPSTICETRPLARSRRPRRPAIGVSPYILTFQDRHQGQTTGAG